MWGVHPNPLSHTETMAPGEAMLDLRGNGMVNTTSKLLASICHPAGHLPTPPPQVTRDPWPQKPLSVVAEQLLPHHKNPFSSLHTRSLVSSDQVQASTLGFLPQPVMVHVCRLCSLFSSRHGEQQC